MKVEDLEFDDAVFQIPQNAVKVSFNIEVYEKGEIGKIHGEFDLNDIREAFRTFEQTVSGEYPVWGLTELGEEYAKKLEERGQ